MSIQIRRMGIEITFRCNKWCKFCDRHCNFKKIPYIADSDMSMEQIDNFIEEVKSKNAYIKRLSILGGEPLVHPKFIEITKKLNELKKIGRIKKPLRILTNRIIEPPKEIAEFANFVTLTPKHKIKEWHYFTHLNPKEEGLNPRYGNKYGCNIPKRCGFVLNKYGYWPCGAGGAVARLFGLQEFARFVLPNNPAKEWSNLEELCQICPYGTGEEIMGYGTDRKISESYKKAFKKMKSNDFHKI